MKYLLRHSLAALVWFTAASWSSAQAPNDGLEPRIVALRGKVVTVQVPEGFDSVTLQSLRRAPRATTTPARPPTWRTLDTQFPQRASATLTFRLGKLTPVRNLRVFGTRGVALPESLFTGPTEFSPDPTGPASTQASALWRMGRVSTEGIPGDALSPAPSGAPVREVEEADIWKIRGNRLLYFNQLRGLQVFDLANPADPALLGTLRLPASGEDLYVLDDTHAALLKRSAGWWDGWWFGGGWGGLGVVPSTALAESSVRLAPSQLSADELRQNELVIASYGDGAPRLLATLPFAGDLLESRLVGSVLYVASSISRELPDNGGWESGTQVVSFDLADPSRPVERAKLFLPIYGAVVSATDRFLFVVNYAWESDTSSVEILDISPPSGAITRLGSVAVGGYIEDKFKLSLNGEILSVASQGWTGRGGGEGDSGEPVTLLQTFSLADPLKPKALGELRIAPGEWVRATRFDGTRAYIVTFEQIDPLHIVDLSDPAHPVVSGAVEVPGFSTYIEPLGDRLATIGLVNFRPSVSLFDVSDATQPKLLSRVKLGSPDSGWAESEAVWNEKAFKVIPDQNLILLPIAGFDFAESDAWGGTWFSRVQIIDLFRDRLVKRGVIEANFAPRRADLYRDQILAISPSKLVSVNAENRDNPIVSAEVDVAWRADRVWRVNDFLLQLGGPIGDGFSRSSTITISPRLEPDHALTVITLPDLEVAGSSLQDGVLYVAQRAWSRWWLDEPEPTDPVGQRLLLSAYDVSALPAVRFLSKATAAVPLSPWSELSALWPSPGTLVWVAEDSWRSWYLASPTADRTKSIPDGLRLTSVDLPVTIGESASWLGGGTKRFIAFDVGTPEKISFASIVDFEKSEGVFSQPFAAAGLLYFSVFTPGEGWLDHRGRAGVRNGNRHALAVVEYRDARAPFTRDERIPLPGELRGLGLGGKLLYTVGPDLNLTIDDAKTDLRALQVSAFDGLAAHLVDSEPVVGVNFSLQVQGEDVFLLQEEPEYIWTRGPVIRLTQTQTVPPGGDPFEPVPNPLTSQLKRLRLDGTRLAVVSEKSLDHDAGLFLFGDLVATQTAFHGVRLLDASNPAELADIGDFTFTGWLWPDLTNADGSLGDGLFIPVGDYGVEVFDLTAP